MATFKSFSDKVKHSHSHRLFCRRLYSRVQAALLFPCVLRNFLSHLGISDNVAILGSPRLVAVGRFCFSDWADASVGRFIPLSPGDRPCTPRAAPSPCAPAAHRPHLALKLPRIAGFARVAWGLTCSEN